MLRGAVLALLLSASAEAAARDFTFSWDTHTLESGKVDAFFEVTPRTGRREYHARFDLSGGAAIAVTRSFEAWLQVDGSFQHNGKNADPSATGHVTSILRHRFLDPANPLGFALQLKVSAGFDDGLVGARFVVDRRIAGVRVAVNGAYERVIFFQGQTGVDSRAEETVALGYRLKNSITPGLEFIAQQSLTGSNFSGAAFFLAASLTFSTHFGWYSLGMMSQVAAVKPDADVGDGERLELRDHERFLFRLAIGLNAL